MESNLIVYIVLDIYPCTTGGLEIFYNKLIPKVAENRNVALITSCKKFESSKVQIWRVPKKYLGLPGATRYGTIILTALKLIKYRKIISIVHLPYTSDSGKWGMVMPFLMKYFNIKYLLHIHGGGMKKWKRFSFDRGLFEHADRLLAVSNTTKNEYRKRSGKEVELVYPLVTFDDVSISNNKIRQKFNFDKNDKIILFVGSLKELKAPDTLLNAFISMGEKFCDEQKLKLVFVGDGDLKEELVSNVNENGFNNYVFFRGSIPYSEVPLYYRMADFFVISSKFEGTPKSLLEAMHNKLPIIGSNVKGITNIIKDGKNGLIYKSGDSEDLKNKLIYLITNSDISNLYAHNSYEDYRSRFNFRNTLDHLLRVYQVRAS